MPTSLLARGITDIVRLSDARMSGTSYGTVVLHISPESAIGGPLAAVQTGDFISLDVPARSLNLELPADTIAQRLAQLPPRPPAYTRGYGQLYLRHVQQAHLGCDFDFLRHPDAC
jgi:dihydroxy-acid dehydratase